MKDKILDYIKDEKFAVISSINEASQPESALVAFSETDSLELLFMTNQNTRKISNILLNPNVAVVIGFGSEKLISIQIEGVARVISLDAAGEYADIHYSKQSGSKEHANIPGECIVVITCLWARYTNYKSKPSEVREEYFEVN